VETKLTVNIILILYYTYRARYAYILCKTSVLQSSWKRLGNCVQQYNIYYNIVHKYNINILLYGWLVGTREGVYERIYYTRTTVTHILLLLLLWSITIGIILLIENNIIVMIIYVVDYITTLQQTDRYCTLYNITIIIVIYYILRRISEIFYFFNRRYYTLLIYYYYIKFLGRASETNREQEGT